MILMTFGAMGCARAHIRALKKPPVAVGTAEASKDPKRAEIFYQQYRVTTTSGMMSQIGDHFYNTKATIGYFSETGAADAAEMIRQSSRVSHRGGVVWGVSAAAGFLVGLAGGAIALSNYTFGHRYNTYGGLHLSNSSSDGAWISLPSSDTEYSTYDQSTPIYLVLGGVAGGILGTMTGWGINRWHYRPKANAMVKEAGNTFNRYLEGRLHLEINTQPSGVSGAVKLDF
jgi:hypothetical protein